MISCMQLNAVMQMSVWTILQVTQERKAHILLPCCPVMSFALCFAVEYINTILGGKYDLRQLDMLLNQQTLIHISS